MDLHRSGKKSEWLRVPQVQWNFWQLLASRTHGIVTPGNVVTVVGFALVLGGFAMIVAEHYWLAVILIGLGRLCDVLDGWLANKTATKSPLGEMLDAGIDKIETALALVILLLADVVPWGAVLAVFVPQSLIALISFYSIYRHRSMHPSELGKYSMAAAWLGIGSFVLRATTTESGDVFWQIAWSLIVLSSLLGVVAIINYMHSYRSPKVGDAG